MSGTARRAAVTCVLIALAALSGRPVLAAETAGRSFGFWRNPSDSVRIRVHPCGRTMCGTVVWASDKAKADALRGGTASLVGNQLFRDFSEEREGVWRGRVFVPDIGKTFSGTVTVLDPNRLEGRGCLIGKVGCKSQIWVRVTTPAP